VTAKSQYDPRLVLGLRWLARLWAAALLLFWGAFFVEHTTEWFVHPHGTARRMAMGIAGRNCGPSCGDPVFPASQ